MRLNEHFDEIVNIFVGELSDSICKCLTGRISRLINVLNGFDTRVVIYISDNQEIGNLVIINKDADINVWKENFIKSMIDHGYDQQIIDEWLIYIE